MNIIKFQKAIPFINNKVSYPCIGQPKINGGRCAAIFDDSYTGDMFSNLLGTYRLHSKEGIDLPVKHIIEELNTVINSNLRLATIKLDGEIYRKDMKVATINGAARNVNNAIHKDLQYVIFDVINEQYQSHRTSITKSLGAYFYVGDPMKHHEWPLGKVIILPSIIIESDIHAKEIRDQYISYGFEGLILRETGSSYTPGKHIGVMYKYKQYEIEEFLVVDIIPKPIDTHLPLFICKNDITSDTFECVPMGTHTKQAKLLINKQYYIGKKVLVKYYERTINKLPFNANVLELD